ncbi:MAG: hypothetical protein PHD31_03265, partial [Candidatus Pacebacteria bacterium]|nr:hypothetical protein [Candidatus Paceibacterota bacterium]
KELDAELARRRVAISGIFQLIKSVLFKDTKKISAEYFYYPEKGMIQLFDLLKKKISDNGGRILLNQDIKEINVKNNQIEHIIFGKSKIVRPDYMISTIPLDSFSKMLNPKIDLDQKISYQRLNIIYFVLNKPKALNDCWIFFPENKLIFQRVSEQKAFSPNTCPKDKTVIMVETTKDINEETMNRIIEQLEKVNILKKEEIEEHFVKSIEKAYPIYKKGFLEQLNKLINNVESIDNFYLLGRQSLFNYNNMDQCWDMALKIKEQIESNKTRKDWQKTKKYFDNYRIVD